MSWVRLVSKRRDNWSKAGAVLLRVSKPGGRFAQRLTIILRPNQIAVGVTWLVKGAFVTVAAGSGDDAGKISITSCRAGDEGAEKLLSVSGRNGGSSLRAVLYLDNLPRGGFPTTVCAYQEASGALYVTLPDGMSLAAPGPQPTEPRPPYRGILARTGAGPGGRPTRPVVAA